MPQSRLHRATVVVNRSAGGEYYRLVLQAPMLASRAKPGHFVMLRVSGNRDPLLARPFGIASVIPRKSIELYYRVAGRGTSLLTAVRPGEFLGLLGPLGNGFPEPAKGATPLLIAGGSGFPPLLFFTAWYGRRARLFVGSRDKACLPPSGAMRDFRSRVESIHYATEDGSRGVCGFVTETLDAYLEGASEDDRPVMYACGPHAMLASVSMLAEKHGVPCYVSMEERMACGLGVCMGCSVPVKTGGYKRVCKEGPVFDAREIEWGGQPAMKLQNAECGVRNEE